MGDKAPLVEAKDDEGKSWKLADHVGERIVVLYFYPADMTPGCTRQACGYRDNLDKLRELGATVVGVSGDSVENHKLFKKAHDLNFTLLADEDGEIAKAYGIPVRAGSSIEREIDGKNVTLTRGVTADRRTVVIGKDGKIADIAPIRDAAGDSERVIGIVRELAEKDKKPIRLGDASPKWKDLAGVDAKKHSLDDYKDAKVLVTVITCNSCPVAKAYEGRLKEFTKAYEGKSVQVVAINVNNTPADSLENMKKRAEAEKFNFPYLYDPSQAIALQLGATVTPHWFVFDEKRQLRYRGAFDDNQDPSRVETTHVPAVVDALLAGKEIENKEARAFGC
ncbi:MAG TPA: redoxin domain-containing protein, partial [Planctomycetota bacterium]|nr:redoxin domain-containing protein [Planctomycetota bacterium]